MVRLVRTPTIRFIMVHLTLGISLLNVAHLLPMGPTQEHYVRSDCGICCVLYDIIRDGRFFPENAVRCVRRLVWYLT